MFPTTAGLAIDLSASITGPEHNAIAVATAPAHGTTTIAGDVITYVPTNGYFGADSFTYTASGPGGTSSPATAPATVTITVTARPDPSLDPAVRVLSDTQVEAARRFARSQTANFKDRAQQLHGGGGASDGMGIRLSLRDVFDPHHDRVFAARDDQFGPTPPPARAWANYASASPSHCEPRRTGGHSRPRPRPSRWGAAKKGGGGAGVA